MKESHLRVCFLGASGEVTGSAYLIESAGHSFLVDFGMFQGSKRTEMRNRVPEQIAPAKLKCVLLTHGHLDHCGRLPILVKAGFNGPIYTTAASADMAGLVLADAAKIAAADCERQNRTRRRAGLPLINPPFGIEEVRHVQSCFKSVEYEEEFKPFDDMSARFVDAGHMLGSGSLHLTIRAEHHEKSIVFSGDIGPKNFPLLRDPAALGGADAVVMESTYGDRNHRGLEATLDEFCEVVHSAVRRKGKILIPAFAIGRTQQLLFHIAELGSQGRFPNIPVFLDTPMGADATELYVKYSSLLDLPAQRFIQSGSFLSSLANVKVCESVDESRAINFYDGPCIVIAGAGMCNGGRILHHLRNNLFNPSTTVIFVGYQAEGTLGRRLVNKASHVTIFGERIAVRAAISTLGGFSAHAGRGELLDWLSSLAAAQPQVILTHGEETARSSLSKAIFEHFELKCNCPGYGDYIDV